MESLEMTMATTARMAVLLVLGVGLWALATLYIHLVPAAFSSQFHSSLGFITALPVGWLSVRLVWRCARLDRSQLVAGIALVGAVAMMIDGLALRFFPWVYSGEPEVLRPASAWLLWGYGVSFAIALWLARAAPVNRRGFATHSPDTQANGS
jgi:hypothetical protein